MVTAREYGDELLRRLLDHLVDATHALGAGVSLTDSSPRSVAAVGAATVLDPAQWKAGDGPLWDAVRGARRVVVPSDADGTAPFDPRRHAGLADLVQGADVDGVRGLVVAPGEWAGEEPLVLSLYLDRPADLAVTAAVDQYESMIGSALAVVEYCAGEELKAEQMLQMVQYRRVIEQAKGLVMASVGGDAGAAFTTLSRASQHFNIRLRNLAVALVEHVGHAPAEGPEDPGQVVVPSGHDRTVAGQVWLALSSAPKGPGALRVDAAPTVAGVDDTFVGLLDVTQAEDLAGAGRAGNAGHTGPGEPAGDAGDGRG